MTEINQAFLIGMAIGGLSVWIPCFLVHKQAMRALTKQSISALEELGSHSKKAINELSIEVVQQQIRNTRNK